MLMLAVTWAQRTQKTARVLNRFISFHLNSEYFSYNALEKILCYVGFQNTKLWNKFEFKGLSNHFKNETKNKLNLDGYFINNSEINMKKNPGYITFGKGFNEY